jgi:hypothetical protein
MTKIVNLKTALTDKNYFGNQLSGDSWSQWRAFLIALAGEPLTKDEHATVCSLSGRQSLPQGAPKEFWAAQWAAGAGNPAQWPAMPLGWPAAMTTALCWHPANAAN